MLKWFLRHVRFPLMQSMHMKLLSKKEQFKCIFNYKFVDMATQEIYKQLK